MLSGRHRPAADQGAVSSPDALFGSATCLSFPKSASAIGIDISRLKSLKWTATLVRVSSKPRGNHANSTVRTVERRPVQVVGAFDE